MAEFDARAYWEDRLTNHYSLHGVGHLRLGPHFNNWMYRVRRHVFLRRMRATGRDFSGASVLEIGAGTGFYVDRWTELGVRDLVGLDITDVATASLAKRYPRYTFLKADIGDDVDMLGGRRFDIASCFDVFFHIIDDQRFDKAIENIAASVAPGGMFVFSDGFIHPEVVARSIQVQHRVSRPLDFIEDTLKRHGFEIVERRPMFYLMSEPLDSASRFTKLRWMVTAGPAALSDLAGQVVGAVLYPIERFLVDRVKESPAVEMMICRRAG
jgi:SAM-dependent methyltransferase